MTRRLMLALGTIATLATSPVMAHHAWPVDETRVVTVAGTVTGYEWKTPHMMIGLEVKAQDGRIEKWSVGGSSPTRLEEKGWDKNTLKAGDVITATGYRFLDGQRVLRLDRIVMASGKEMLVYGRRN